VHIVGLYVYLRKSKAETYLLHFPGGNTFSSAKFRSCGTEPTARSSTLTEIERACHRRKQHNSLPHWH
jgi:hypothetical protein